jgi:hypothetical protein
LPEAPCGAGDADGDQFRRSALVKFNVSPTARKIPQ